MSIYLDELRALEARHVRGEYLSDREFWRMLDLMRWTCDERATMAAETAAKQAVTTSSPWPTGQAASLLTTPYDEYQLMEARQLARKSAVVNLDEQRKLRGK